MFQIVEPAPFRITFQNKASALHLEGRAILTNGTLPDKRKITLFDNSMLNCLKKGQKYLSFAL
ncbi:hypothetical protein DZ860_04805 [Vibrio sinensis]|uniref:Uncharacterized protein n=1 Tax=Vibrio sinensis TaxID=2302434 RepID=A0A3A6QT03_9VIBR|nr:hypothetical protein DZ860_04805 [Vibrio sinensis]